MFPCPRSRRCQICPRNNLGAHAPLSMAVSSPGHPALFKRLLLAAILWLLPPLNPAIATKIVPVPSDVLSHHQRLKKIFVNFFRTQGHHGCKVAALTAMQEKVFPSAPSLRSFHFSYVALDRLRERRFLLIGAAGFLHNPQKSSRPPR